MGSVNRVILIGNLGADPDVRQVGQTSVCNLRLATTERFKDRDGNIQEKTEWHRVNVWGAQGDACARCLAKGRQVYVEGQLQTREWTDQQGVKRYSTEVRADHVVFLGSGDGQRQRQDGGGGQRRDPTPSRGAAHPTRREDTHHPDPDASGPEAEWKKEDDDIPF